MAPGKGFEPMLSILRQHSLEGELDLDSSLYVSSALSHSATPANYVIVRGFSMIKTILSS